MVRKGAAVKVTAGEQFVPSALDNQACLAIGNTQSAKRICKGRCVLSRVVRLSKRRQMVRSISSSEARLIPLVESSRIRMRDEERDARAMVRRCRWPLDSVTPRLPMTVS